MAVQRPRRLILCCTLCAPHGQLIEPTTERAFAAAVDHALDEHRDELLFDHEAVLGELRVVA